MSLMLLDNVLTQLTCSRRRMFLPRILLDLRSVVKTKQLRYTLVSHKSARQTEREREKCFS